MLIFAQGSGRERTVEPQTFFFCKMSTPTKSLTVDPHIYDHDYLVNNLLKEAEQRLESRGLVFLLMKYIF
jgi:hypothetical protein